MADTVVFIPAWNEEANLPAVLHDLPKRALPDADLLVVDDGSTDRTADVAREHGAEVLSFGENRGLRAGIAAGYGWAHEHGYAFCGRVDADGQHPAASSSGFSARVREDRCDVAVGSRFVAGEGYEALPVQAEPERRFGIAVLRRAMATRLKRPFGDATSGCTPSTPGALRSWPSRTSRAPEVEGSRGSPRPGSASTRCP